ncbi:4-hydroxy-tetrahydrodipicolinate synthase [Lottiidibacillus patelloidae]|uniref:4-hydroxy-tetrahydrodipicolinate synthase n=2 Tax=Lottiidibacillus patelloidae TaxID=2670334 RepID=A0A263BYG4_9BACI|nr:4-hydroxy-tetrahydrodipicolinate synthase [Lottiidibacillus patelloidae]
MVTPFDNKLNIDFQKTTKLVNYLIENGTDALVICGTTGESPTLTTEEKVALYQHVVKTVDGRVPVIAGTGSNNTKASIDLTKKAEEAGVDAVMLVAPYYNKPSQEGLYQHFKQIASSTKLPVMIYNIPGRSVVDIQLDTIISLSKISNIVSIKEATNNLDRMAAIIDQTPDDFSVYSGDDSLTLPVLAIGGTGIVSVASHVLGLEMQQMVNDFKSGKVEEAAKLHRSLVPKMNGLFMAPSPGPVKTALQIKGLDVGSVRLPLVPLTEKERKMVVDLIK